MKFKFLKAALTGLIVSVSSFANAELMMINNASLFESTASDVILVDDYNDIDSFNTIRGTLDRGLYSIVEDKYTIALAGVNGVDRTGSFIMGYGYSQAKFDLDFSVQAFSFDIWAGFGNQRYEVTVGLDSIFIDLAGGYNNYQFFGFISDSPFDSFTIRDVDSEGNGYFDNFSVAIAVPEPSTLAIFALGMICLASRRFKKQ